MFKMEHIELFAYLDEILTHDKSPRASIPNLFYFSRFYRRRKSVGAPSAAATEIMTDVYLFITVSSAWRGHCKIHNISFFMTSKTG
jgi:hypothetical protein